MTRSSAGAASSGSATCGPRPSTVFLVSHSEQSIRDTCERSIWLESGLIRADGPTEDVLKEYEAYVKR
nr:hypothetical protein GCM10020092_103600 [Actinoplanes digitatis]